jgi:hypothetical protein
MRGACKTRPVASVEQPVERLSATEMWAYVVIALVSVLTSPITVIFALLVGMAVGIVGACRGAASRTEQETLRGVRVLLYGLAILAGPTLYLSLAVAVRLV